VIPAIERLVFAYLDLRDSRDETFLETYKRLGAAPFKAALYPEPVAQSDAA
jgi:sulfite reductase (NADPH) hemoprotein beta-component